MVTKLLFEFSYSQSTTFKGILLKSQEKNRVQDSSSCSHTYSFLLNKDTLTTMI